jgi:signal transduction histidine kinase
MGWGLLFFGYFLEFILGINSMFAPFVYLIGFAVILMGVSQLARYCKSFLRAKWCVLALMVLSVWRTYAGLNDLFSLGLPFVNQTVSSVVSWLFFLGMTLFHVFLALSVKELALRVDSNKNAVRALRNLVMYGLYAVAYLLSNTMTGVKSLVPIVLLLWPVWAICNCVMLYSCYMHIVPADQEEQAGRPLSRFAFVNRFRAAMDAKEQKAIEADRAYHAENARRRMEKLSRKQQARAEAKERNRKD